MRDPGAATAARSIVMAAALAAFGPAIGASAGGDRPGAAAAAAPLAAAQPSGATIYGTVYDQTARLLPGATIVLVNVPSQTATTLVTDANGDFVVQDMPPGEYEIEVNFPGFELARAAYALRPGQTVQRDFTLELGTVQETLTIYDEGPQAAVEAPPQAGVPAAAGPEAAAGRCDALSAIGGCIRPPRRLNAERPRYPLNLQGSGIAGIVVVRARIGLDGRLTALEATESAHAEFAQAAIDALDQWQFEPAALNAETIEANIQVSLYFAPAQQP